MVEHKVKIRVVKRNLLSRFVRKLFKRNSVADPKRKSVVKDRKLRVRRGDSVEFNAADPNVVAIFIPYKELLVEKGPVFDLIGYKTKVTVRKDAPLGVYVYTVYSTESNDLANKPPKMIVD